MSTKIQIKGSTLSISGKVSDMLSATLIGPNGEIVHEQESGYVPDFMPGDHYGDYVMLDIDLETGQIKNWKTPTLQAIREWMKDAST